MTVGEQVAIARSENRMVSLAAGGRVAHLHIAVAGIIINGALYSVNCSGIYFSSMMK